VKTRGRARKPPRENRKTYQEKKIDPFPVTTGKGSMGSKASRGGDSGDFWGPKGGGSIWITASASKKKRGEVIEVGG